MWINSDKQIVLSCSNPHVFYDRMRITKDVASTMWVISENLKQKTDSFNRVEQSLNGTGVGSFPNDGYNQGKHGINRYSFRYKQR